MTIFLQTQTKTPSKLKQSILLQSAKLITFLVTDKTDHSIAVNQVYLSCFKRRPVQ
jgi:hypothetical protein